VGVEWIQLAQDRDLQRAVVNAVMKLRVLAPQLVNVNCISHCLLCLMDNRMLRRQFYFCLTLSSFQDDCCHIFQQLLSENPIEYYLPVCVRFRHRPSSYKHAKNNTLNQ
jgi:hypothetical protein